MVLEEAEYPRFGWITDMRPALADARVRRVPVALATIVRLEGSSPRPVGTQMVFEGRRAVGYFTGGCLEADIANHATEVVETGEAKLLTYGRGSPWIDIRLTCGGRMDILVERICPDDEAVHALLNAAADRVAVTWISDGSERSIHGHVSSAACWDEAALRISLPVEPPRRLLVAGGDPTALAIAELGSKAGWNVVQLRPQSGTAECAFPTVLGLQACLAELGVADQWTACAIATHDSELDHMLIAAALRSSAHYVGALGARSRLPERIARLRAEGADTARLHAPMGTAPTGKAPWEVAVAVIAEIMALFQVPVRQCR